MFLNKIKLFLVISICLNFFFLTYDGVKSKEIKIISGIVEVTDGDTKSIKVFKICATGTGCMSGSSDTIFDELYIGRVEINTNGGNKRRTLYFQADYIFKE